MDWSIINMCIRGSDGGKRLYRGVRRRRIGGGL